MSKNNDPRHANVRDTSHCAVLYIQESVWLSVLSAKIKIMHEILMFPRLHPSQKRFPSSNESPASVVERCRVHCP